MRRVAFLFGLLIPCAVFARTVLPISTDPGSNVHLQIESCFSELPSSGYAPVEVTINNSSGQMRKWDLKFASPSWAYYGAPMISERMFYATSVTVETGAARTFKFLVPLTTSASELSGLGVSLTGYGLPNGAQEVFHSGSPTGKAMTPCMILSEGAAPEFESRLLDAARANSQQLHGVKCKADELPEEWRAFSGFAAVWLMESEWKALSAPQRTALEDWVAVGGRLFLYTQTSPAPPRRIGLGSIVTMDRNAKDLYHSQLKTLLMAAHPPAGRATPATETLARRDELARGDIMGLINDDRAHWNAVEEIGVLQPNLPLLVSFLAIFAILVGPLNLFVFAREEQRSRLFWTVPAISLGATVLLLILIMVQDGFGGGGIRSVLICLVPSSRKAVVIQEQISRTGVLGSAAFSLRDPAWMTMVNVVNGSIPYREIRSVQNSGTRYSGEWFKSRSVQSQWIESVLPTRAEVTLVNSDETRDGRAAPAIISSIASPLSNLWFWDSNGRLWGASNVRTGVKTALSPGTASKNLLVDARIALRRRMAGADGVAGNFVALSTDAAAFIETLPAIRWKNRQAIYVGPVTGAAPPK